MSNDNWTPWHGGKCPIKSAKTKGCVRFRAGCETDEKPLKSCYWSHNTFPQSGQIVAYKITENHEPPEAEMTGKTLTELNVKPGDVVGGGGVMGQPTGFSVIRRNYGHWDIVRSTEGRLFRLRGGPGEWRIIDERMRGSSTTITFKDQSAAMAYVCAELMHELIIAEGQTPHVIESWNVSARKEPTS